MTNNDTYKVYFGSSMQMIQTLTVTSNLEALIIKSLYRSLQLYLIVNYFKITAFYLTSQYGVSSLFTVKR